MPPAKVEVAVDVEVREPVVNAPAVRLEKMAEVARKIFAKSEVVVALVVVALEAMRLPLKVWSPLQVFTSARSVEDAKVQVEVAKEYTRPVLLTASPPVESAESVSELVAV